LRVSIRHTPRFSPPRSLAAALGLGCALALAGCADRPAPATAAAAAPLLEPEAEAALRRMSVTLAGAPGFAFRLHTLRETRLEDGQAVLLAATSAILVRRPDRMTVQVGSDVGNFALWFDGAQVTLFNPDANLHGSTPLSGDILAAADWLRDRMGLALPVRPVLAPDPYAALTGASPTSGRRLGASLVGETPVEHFAFRNASLDWEIWLEATPRALPRRVSVVQRTPQGPLRTTLEFEAWTLAPAVGAQAFRFVPPRGSVPATLVPLPDAGQIGSAR
jgi:hypothetical protein